MVDRENRGDARPRHLCRSRIESVLTKGLQPQALLQLPPQPSIPEPPRAGSPHPVQVGPHHVRLFRERCAARGEEGQLDNLSLRFEDLDRLLSQRGHRGVELPPSTLEPRAPSPGTLHLPATPSGKSEVECFQDKASKTGWIRE